MAKPVVAIVGRPNVGKSTLFNKLIGQRLSIVDDTPGVTRDRIYGDCEWEGRKFSLVDTGGIEPSASDVILSQMRAQAQLAIDAADVIILVTDIRSGLVATDADIAAMLLKSGRPVILCVNKCDSVGEPPADFYEFYNLGLGDPVQVSSVHGHGTGDLLDRVVEYLPAEPEGEEDGELIRVWMRQLQECGSYSVGDQRREWLASMFYAGCANDLEAKLLADGRFGLTPEAIEELLDVRKFVGMAPRQVEEYLNGEVYPMLNANSGCIGSDERSEIKC